MTSKRMVRKYLAPPTGGERAYYHGLAPLQQPYQMMYHTTIMVAALGEEGIKELSGVALLAAVAGAPHLLVPQTALEALIAGFRTPWRLVEELKAYEPELTVTDWERIAKSDWSVRNDQRLSTLSLPAQLLLYQQAAWRAAFNYVGRDIGETVDMWDRIPVAVQRDPMMQQIVAFRMAPLFETVVERTPNWGWDPVALGLFLQKQGFPDLTWVQRCPLPVLEMLLVYHEDNTTINAMETWLLNFTPEQLPVVCAQHPALFIQGLILDKERRDDPLAKTWFAPMWQASLERIARHSSYAQCIVNQRMQADEGKHLRVVMQMFAPDALATFSISQALHDTPSAAWMHWLTSQANAQTADFSVALPDLGNAGEHSF